MTTNYEKLLLANLEHLYKNLPKDLETWIPATKKKNMFFFRAFGEDCCLGPEGITLSEIPTTGPKGLIISLYASHAGPDPIKRKPFRAFREMPDSMPYQQAFIANSERVLIPHVSQIRETQEVILQSFNGINLSKDMAGDFCFVIYPLPKIALCYIFYIQDEEFPASCSCLYSSNAVKFMPIDGLADVAEYTSKRIIQLIE